MASHFRLSKKQIFTAQSVSSTTVYTSPAIHSLNLDNMYVQLVVASGTPVGSMAIQVSNDHVEDLEGNVLVAGTWVTVLTVSVSSSASPIGADLNQIGAPWMRVVYTNASSSGVLNGYVSGKGLM